MKKILLFIVVSIGLLSCSDSEVTTDGKTKEKVISGDFSGKTVGYSAYTLKGPYYGALYDTIKKEAEDAGFDFIGIDAEDDFQKQTNDVEDLLVKGVDVLILNPLDPVALVPITKRAMKEGIPVIVVDSIIDNSADIVSMVTADNSNNGEFLGQILAEKMKSVNQIKLALLSGRQGNPVGKERRMGFLAGLTEANLKVKGKSNVEVLTQLWGSWDEQGGVKAMEDILVSSPNVNVIFAENDSMAIGAIRVLKQAGKLDDVIVVGYDGTKAAYDAIKAGDMLATALNSPFLMGEKTIEIAKEFLQGKRNFPRRNSIYPAAISAKNVDEFYSGGF